MSGISWSSFVVAKLYGGFFVVDLRLLAWLVILCVLLSLGSVLVWQRIRGLGQMVPIFAALFLAFLLAGFVVLHWVAGYPVFVIRSFFQLP